MYGSEDLDPVVKYYDASFALGSAEEVAWYLRKVHTFGGPVLDLACGTGRLALMLAKAGYDVTGLDQSAGMLNQFRKKLKQEGADVQRRMALEQQRMADFSLGRRFKTIICCDAFFHNLTVDDQIGCLTRVAEHLEPEGRFVFNLPNPTCEFILNAARTAGATFTERGRYRLKDEMGTLLVEQAQAGDVLQQTITTTLRLTRYDAEGNAVEQNESTWTSRYIYRYEAVHLLHRCGFEIEALVGTYRDEPITEKGQLIFQVKRTA